MMWPFAPLVPLSYSVIVADPPWRFRTWGETNQAKSASRHYSLMTTEAICELPVHQLAQKDCLLLLWATGAMLPQAMEVMKSWGFVYKSMMAWRKITASGKVRMGTGYWTRSMHESILLGTLGNPGKISGFPSIFDGVAREHSRKPDEFYDLVLKHSDGLRRADLFSRESRAGFEAFGNEAGKFDAAACRNPLASSRQGETAVSWTEQRIDDLRRHFANGLSASQIAGELGGVSRNGVIGKLHRMGLRREHKPRVRKQYAPRSARGEAVSGLMARIESKLRHAAKAGTSAPQLERAAPPVDQPPLHIDFRDLNERTCKFAFGDEAPFTFCGHATAPGLPYCKAHCLIAYQPIDERRQKSSEKSSLWHAQRAA